MVETYLASRATLAGVVLVVDIRRTPGAKEQALIRWLDHHRRPYRIVVTKADKLSRNQQVRPLRIIAEAFGCPRRALLPCSAKTGDGLAAVWQAIEAMLSVSV